MKKNTWALFGACLLIASAGCQLTTNQSAVIDSNACDPNQKGTAMVERDGMKYEILTASDNETVAKTGNQVTVHYTGWLDDGNGKEGKKFDSSVDRGEKFTFGLGMGWVIQGWDKGVVGMHVGEKRRLYIPSEMGYGARGAGGAIPPNADLIFDVELFEAK
jgi:FKBP-type peptidyl-prolyl cis-trans isomerase